MRPLETLTPHRRRLRLHLYCDSKGCIPEQSRNPTTTLRCSCSTTRPFGASTRRALLLQLRLVSCRAPAFATMSPGNYVGSPDGRNYFYNSGGVTGQILGSYTAADIFTGFLPGLPPPVPAAAWAFSTTRVPGSTYDYESAAQLATIAGEWSVVTPRGGSNLTVSATGVVVGGSVAGCQVSGSLTPRAGGKNVFSADLVFGPPLPLAVCDVTGPASGVAVVTLESVARRQLMVAVQNPTRTLGVGFFGDAPR